VNRWNQHNTFSNARRNWYNRRGNWNRPWFAGRPAWYWGRPWYIRHWSWHRGFWSFWQAPPILWFGAGATAGFLASPGDTFIFNNPFFIQPTSTTIVLHPSLDYSSPIPLPPPDQSLAAFPPEPEFADDGNVEYLSTADPPAPATEDSTVNEADRQFDAARASFKDGDFAKAQALAEKAIALLPSDATLHEFRALTLFAQKKYQDAAAALYAVLAAGPGWDWRTVSTLYGNADAYTRQLRALEEYARQHPKDAAPHFLLAYHYLVLGHPDAAVQQLKHVAQLKPDDMLTAALLEALAPDGDASAGAPPEPGARD
jgi:tetratricopeptide (TPR) repeat protein